MKVLLGGAAQKAGILLVNNGAGIALAMAFVSLPFLINAARDGFAAVPERTEKAALTLGASPVAHLFHRLTAAGMAVCGVRLHHDVRPRHERVRGRGHHSLPPDDSAGADI
ncbi:MAG: hypothetical protein MZV63_39045 [Marinilabiliales bacterium]|nr:hypothetical protein [Marinilabiliales bacterium]